MEMYVDVEVDAPRILKLGPLPPGSSELWIAVRGEVGFIAGG